MKIRFSVAASNEYLGAVEYYNDLREGLGYEFAVEMDDAIDRIQQYSTAWQSIAEDIRRCLIRRFPYGIIYTVLDGDIIVLSIMNLRKNPESWNRQA